MNHQSLLIFLYSWELDCILWHFFQNHFQVYFWKKLLAYLVISSGNSHLLSSALEMVLTFLWITESSPMLSDSEEELDDWHGEEAVFCFFPPSSLIFSPPSIYRVSTALGSGWTISTEFIIVLLLDGSCKSIFLSFIPSSASTSVFYIGASIN